VPPIRPLDFDDLAPDARAALRARYERLGYLGDFFRYMGHQPQALVAFDSFTEACKQALPMHVAEAIALTAATRLGNEYERNQHERLAVRGGASRAWVADVERLDPDGTGVGLGDDVRAAQRFVLAAIDDLVAARSDGSESPRRLDEIVTQTDDATASAVALLTARFVAHALVSRACRLTASVPSIFEDGFDG
jgi:alkylhydroperoxidase family enzyme